MLGTTWYFLVYYRVGDTGFRKDSTPESLFKAILDHGNLGEFDYYEDLYVPDKKGFGSILKELLETLINKKSGIYAIGTPK